MGSRPSSASAPLQPSSATQRPSQGAAHLLLPQHIQFLRATTRLSCAAKSVGLLRNSSTASCRGLSSCGHQMQEQHLQLLRYLAAWLQVSGRGFDESEACQWQRTCASSTEPMHRPQALLCRKRVNSVGTTGCLPGAVGQGPVVAFNLFRSCGAYVGYRWLSGLPTPCMRCEAACLGKPCRCGQAGSCHDMTDMLLSYDPVLICPAVASIPSKYCCGH